MFLAKSLRENPPGLFQLLVFFALWLHNSYFCLPFHIILRLPLRFSFSPSRSSFIRCSTHSSTQCHLKILTLLPANTLSQIRSYSQVPGGHIFWRLFFSSLLCAPENVHPLHVKNTLSPSHQLLKLMNSNINSKSNIPS